MEEDKQEDWEDVTDSDPVTSADSESSDERVRLSRVEKSLKRLLHQSSNPDEDPRAGPCH
jgi:hypothetical protein